MSALVDGIVMEPEWWPAIASALPKPWPTQAALADLAWWAERVAATKEGPEHRRVKRPSRVSLADRWGWTERPARALITDYDFRTGRPAPDVREAPDASEETDLEHPGALTHRDVVDRAVRWLRGHHKCSSAYSEIAIPGEMVFPDAIGFRGSWSILVEAKVSRSDFRADRSKAIHESPNACPGQERWYLTPPNLVYPGEVPAGWGLAEVFAQTVKIRLPAPVGEADPDRARADMRILTAVTRRHEVGAKWDHEAGRFAPVGST